MKDSRISILYVHHGLGVGGAPISLSNIISSLDPVRFHVKVATRRSRAVDLFEEVGADIELVTKLPAFRHTTAGSDSPLSPLFYLRLFSNWRQQKWWREFFLKHQAEIVHLNSVTLLPLCKPAHQAGSKVVISIRETILHGWLGLRKRWMRRQIEKYADAIHHISTYDKNLLGANNEIVRVIPNWVDLEDFDRQISPQPVRQELGLAANDKLVVTFGGATPIKGTHIFLEAAHLLRKHQGWHFAVVGLEPPTSSDMRLSLRRVAKWLLRLDNKERLYRLYLRHQLQENVTFLGLRRDIPHILAACDVLVFPALVPHQSRPALEAGAMARPVITSDFECFEEFLVDGENALKFTPGNACQLAERIARLLRDEELARTLGEANYRMTYQYHRRSTNAPRVYDIYEQVLRSTDDGS